MYTHTDTLVLIHVSPIDCIDYEGFKKNVGNTIKKNHHSCELDSRWKNSLKIHVLWHNN